MTERAQIRLKWIDILKGLAISAILVHHFCLSASHFAMRPTDKGFCSSLSQIWQVATSITVNRVDAALAALAGFGYQGVHLFFVASGFGLAMAELKRNGPLTYGQFLKARAVKLLPPYWAFVLLLGLIGFLQSRLHLMPAWVIGSNRKDLLINLFLLRNFREQWAWIYPGSLWFIPVIIELYLVYPLISWGIRRFGAAGLGGCLTITLVYRAIAVYGLNGGVIGTDSTVARDIIPMLFFPARLFEFALGVWLARKGLLAPGRGESPRRSMMMLVVGLAVWVLGTVAACHLNGFFVSDPLIGAGSFFVVYQISRIASKIPLIGAVLALLGRQSYSVYLMHSMLMPSPLAMKPGTGFTGHFALFCAAALLLGSALDGLLVVVRTTAGLARLHSPRLHQPRTEFAA